MFTPSIGGLQTMQYQLAQQQLGQQRHALVSQLSALDRHSPQTQQIFSQTAQRANQQELLGFQAEINQLIPDNNPIAQQIKSLGSAFVQVPTENLPLRNQIAFRLGQLMTLAPQYAKSIDTIVKRSVVFSFGQVKRSLALLGLRTAVGSPQEAAINSRHSAMSQLYEQANRLSLMPHVNIHDMNHALQQQLGGQYSLLR